MTPAKKFTSNALFRQRALAEAARYGSDSWVFVRELLQNARDAGARHVTLTTTLEEGVESISCRDDGCGMSQEHAERYLFALYASSKEDHDDEAGKFGIGFWSVLRFEPETITIRSRAGLDDAWEASLDGRLEWATVEPSRLEQGTEIVLRRNTRDGTDSDALGREVSAAARKYARFLTCRDGKGEPLRVSVDGRPVNAELKLPAPSATFSGPGFRGAVGLGKKPRVELFAHGLFVRSADSLQDLEDESGDRQRGAAEDALADLPSLAPQVILDSTELDLLLARSDVRQDRHLDKMLRAAGKALDRLITRQLQALKPQPWYRLWWGSLRDRLAPWFGKPTLGMASLIAFSAIAGAFLLSTFFPVDLASPGGPLSTIEHRSDVPSDGPAGELLTGAPLSTPDLSPGSSRDDPPARDRADILSRLVEEQLARALDQQPTPRSTTRFREYGDLSRRYRGPQPTGSDHESDTPIALAYTPPNRRLLFNALVIEDLQGLQWNPEPPPDELPRYSGTQCTTGCVDVELLVENVLDPLRVPVPTGHRLDTASLRLGGLPARVYESSDGEAILRLDELDDGERLTTWLLEYRTGPAPAGRRRLQRAREEPTPLLARTAESLKSLPIRQRADFALRYVSDHIRYDPSRAVTAAYAGEPGRDFIATALEIGAGDCDVQNGVLVELLRLAGVEVRLALGYVGSDGTVGAGLHAWAEYLDEEGHWREADASLLGAPAAAPTGPATLSAATGALAGAEESPVDVLSSVGISQESSRRMPALLVAVLLLAGGTTALATFRRVSRHHPGSDLDLDSQGNLAALLGGALRHPAAFAGLPAMAHGRFVPLLGRDEAVSLDRARRLAASHRLFRSDRGSSLARKAADRGVLVVDSGTAEGRVLSLALGAIDLDHWSNLLDRCADAGLATGVNRQLERLGEPWRIRTVSELDGPLVELALEDLKLDRRLVLIDPEHEIFAPIERLRDEKPEAAAFSALDLIAHRLDLDSADRTRLLADAGRRALREADA